MFVRALNSIKYVYTHNTHTHIEPFTHTHTYFIKSRTKNCIYACAFVHIYVFAFMNIQNWVTYLSLSISIYIVIEKLYVYVMQFIHKNTYICIRTYMKSFVVCRSNINASCSFFQVFAYTHKCPRLHFKTTPSSSSRLT